MSNKLKSKSLKLILASCICLLGGISVNALDLVSIKSVYTSIDMSDSNVKEDLKYMNNVAGSYAHKYIVKKDLEYDVSEINKVFNDLLKPLTLEELDKGAPNFDLDVNIGSRNFRENMLKMRVMGDFVGYKINFKPLVAYEIYRDIVVVGGYMDYTGSNIDLNDGVKKYVKGVENLTKEVVPSTNYDSIRQDISSTIRFMDKDTGLKVFILKNGKIDSMFEK